VSLEPAWGEKGGRGQVPQSKGGGVGRCTVYKTGGSLTKEEGERGAFGPKEETLMHKGSNSLKGGGLGDFRSKERGRGRGESFFSGSRQVNKKKKRDRNKIYVTKGG